MKKLKHLISELYSKHKNFIIYALIGVSNTLLDFVVFTVLRYFNLHYLIANIISYHCGILNSFFLNRHFNFKVKDKPVKRFLSFYSASLVAIVLSELLMYLFVSVLNIHDLVAKLISTFAIFIVQFVFVKFVTFKR